MALARVVSFDGVDSDRMAALKSEIEGGEQPEGMNATEMLLLHDPSADQALAIIFFDNEGDYQKGDEILSAMPTSDTPGQRTGVKKYDVAVQMKA
jgi:hypothetical protein